MRKYLPIMLSAALALPVMACNNEDDQTNTNTNGKKDTNNKDKDKDKKATGAIAKINTGVIGLSEQVKVEAVVTAVSNYYDNKKKTDTAIQGLYISDIVKDAEPYSGIYAFFQNKADLGAFEIGDIVEISGVVADHYGLQITISDIKKTGKGTVPNPAVISDPASIATKYDKSGDYYAVSTKTGADAKKYRGVLVQIKDVESTVYSVAVEVSCSEGSTPPCHSGKGFEVNDALVIANTLYYTDKNLRTVGTKFSSITGIVFDNYNAFMLYPRQKSDVVVSGTVIDDSSSDYEVTAINKIQDGTAKDKKVEVTAQIVSGIGHDEFKDDEANNGYSFYAADANGDAVYVYKAAAAKNFQIKTGDTVTVKGKAIDYHGQMEISPATVAKADKTVITASVDMSLPVAEQDRGHYAKFSDLTVKEAADSYCTGAYTKDNAPEGANYCTATMTDGTNELKIKYTQFSDNLKADSKALIGKWLSNANDEFASISGILDVSYGEIVLFPQSDDDFEKAVDDDTTDTDTDDEIVQPIKEENN